MREVVLIGAFVMMTGGLMRKNYFSILRKNSRENIYNPGSVIVKVQYFRKTAKRCFQKVEKILE